MRCVSLALNHERTKVNLKCCYIRYIVFENFSTFWNENICHFFYLWLYNSFKIITLILIPLHYFLISISEELKWIFPIVFETIYCILHVNFKNFIILLALTGIQACGCIPNLSSCKVKKASQLISYIFSIQERVIKIRFLSTLSGLWSKVLDLIINHWLESQLLLQYFIDFLILVIRKKTVKIKKSMREFCSVLIYCYFISVI